MREPFKELLRGEHWYTMQAASYGLAWDADWMQEASIILFQTHKNWDESDDRDFGSVLYDRIAVEADKYYNNKRKILKKEAPEELHDKAEYYNQLLEWEIDLKWFKKRVKDLLRSFCTEKEYSIVHAYFYKGLTQEQIADKMRLSQPTVCKTLNNLLTKLKDSPEFENLWVLSKELL